MSAALQALPGFPLLATPRLRLRAASADDAPALFRLFSDPRVLRHWPRVAMVDRAEADARVAEDAERFRCREMIAWVVARRRDDIAVGTCSLHGFARDRALVGYALHPDAQGHGLAREAVARVLGFAFDALRLARVEAEVAAGNARSAALLARLGFAEAGPAADGMMCRWWLAAPGRAQGAAAERFGASSE